MKQTITERLDEWERRKKCCFELFEDYRKGLLDYANWMEAWRNRQAQSAGDRTEASNSKTLT